VELKQLPEGASNAGVRERVLRGSTHSLHAACATVAAQTLELSNLKTQLTELEQVRRDCGLDISEALTFALFLSLFGRYSLGFRSRPRSENYFGGVFISAFSLVVSSSRVHLP
jgi:hypothetical protein